MILISKHFWYIQQEKRAVWGGTRPVTHNLHIYYTLYILCTITSVHYQGAAAKADAIGEHWIESGAVDTYQGATTEAYAIGEAAGEVLVIIIFSLPLSL